MTLCIGYKIMIIKEADNKQSDIITLRKLIDHPNANKKLIERQIRFIQSGVLGEKEAAYEFAICFGKSNDWMVINDLRIECDNDVAQIDHLIINRWLNIWVCESKNFSQGIKINEHGEFTQFFNRKPNGIPSPIEQNNRHILILERLLNSGSLNLPVKPVLKSLILISKNFSITRPKKEIDGISCIIKTDQACGIITREVNSSDSPVVSQDMLEKIANEIVSCHKPIAFNWAGKFGLSSSEQTFIKKTNFKGITYILTCLLLISIIGYSFYHFINTSSFNSILSSIKNPLFSNVSNKHKTTAPEIIKPVEQTKQNYSKYTDEQVTRAVKELLVEKQSHQPNAIKPDQKVEEKKPLYEIELFSGGIFFTDNVAITNTEVTYKDNKGMIVSLNKNEVKTIKVKNK